MRPRRPGQGAGNSNLRGGGRRQNGNQEHNIAAGKTMGTVVRNKFDSIAQAYHSTTANTVGMHRADQDYNNNMTNS